MSDGGEVEGEREKEGGPDASERAGAGEFGRAVSKIAVAQICESVGFECFNQAALETLTDIAVQYVHDLGKTAAFYANLAGRTDCNVFDVMQVLEDLRFPGASGVGDCRIDSATLREIAKYVESAEEIPFAQPVPRFPVGGAEVMTPSFVQMGETPAFKHVPTWLPAFPDPHTYIRTPMWNERVTDPRADKIELARQRRKAERSLLSLQQRLVCSGSALASTSTDVGNNGKALQVGGTKNAFLTAPLEAAEKDVSPVVLPAKLLAETIVESHSSVFETFAPAIDAVKGGFSDAGDGDKLVLTDSRPTLRLNSKTGKKMLGESLSFSLQKNSAGKTASWIGRDDEKDDKKRRAQLILRQSMENPQELSQL